MRKYRTASGEGRGELISGEEAIRVRDVYTQEEWEMHTWLTAWRSVWQCGHIHPWNNYHTVQQEISDRSTLCCTLVRTQKGLKRVRTRKTSLMSTFSKCLFNLVLRSSTLYICPTSQSLLSIYIYHYSHLLFKSDFVRVFFLSILIYHENANRNFILCFRSVTWFQRTSLVIFF